MQVRQEFGISGKSITFDLRKPHQTETPMYQKFIITNEGVLRFGNVYQHRELLRWDEACPYGGGLWKMDHGRGIVLLYGRSFAFGPPCFEQVKRSAKILRQCGIKNVMISLGEKGAMLCCDSGIYVAKAPKVEVVSTVGAGDSSLAGFIWAKLKKQSDTAALTMAVSCGSAACISEGSLPPKKEIIKKLVNEVEIQIL